MQSVKTASTIPIRSGDTRGATCTPRGLRYKYRATVRGLKESQMRNTMLYFTA